MPYAFSAHFTRYFTRVTQCLRLQTGVAQFHRCGVSNLTRSIRVFVPAPITSALVWKEIEKRSFAVLSYVNPKGRARSSGIVYVPIDRVLYVRVAKDSWKAKHIRRNPHVALNVPIPKRVPFMPWIDIPDATIALSGTARVLSMGEVEPKLLDALLERMFEHANNDENCIIEIRPTGHFATYGVGVSLLDMRDPEKARGRTPVG